MAILEVGINIGMKSLVEIKYYRSSDNVLDPNLRAGFLTALESFTSEVFGDDISVISLGSFKLVCYCEMIRLPGSESENKQPLLSYAIIEKGTEVNIVKEQLEIASNNGNILVNLMLWDVAGQPQFYMLHKPYFNGADGMILVFDITRSSTFSNVKNWYNTAVKYGLSGIPRILIGNKIDLKDERKIVQPHADHLSDELNAQYFETSALTGVNVKSIFEDIATKVYISKTKK